MSTPQPIFILASPRSFTSLICAMLGQHPQAYGVPELNLFATDTLEQFVQRMANVRQFQTHGLLRTIAQLYCGEQTLYAIDTAHRWISRRLHHTVGQVYQELCTKVAPLRIIDKSPTYASNRAILNRIYRTFPDAYYIHLLRHPRTQCRSVSQLRGGTMMMILTHSADYSTNPLTIDPQYMWYKMQSTIVDFLSSIPESRKIQILGENLLNEPALYLEKICQKLNFDCNESILEAMLNPQNSVYAKIGPYGAHLGNDPNFLKSPSFHHQVVAPSKLEGSLPWRGDDKGFMPEVVKLAQEFGYE